MSQVTNAGSTFYLPPEIFSGKMIDANPKLDIWAIGCILYSMVLGYLPFSENSEKATIKKIKEVEVSFPK